MTKPVRYSKPLVVRLKPQTKERLSERAEKKGQRVSEYIRDMIEQDEKKAQ